MQKRRTTVWKKEISEILASKVDEFHLLGYDKATKESIWGCLVKQVWKGDPELFLFEVVADVFQLNPTTYMNYLTLNTYKESDDLMASIQALTQAENKKSK